MGANKQWGHHGISHWQWWAPIRVSLLLNSASFVSFNALILFQDAEQPGRHDGCHWCGGHWLPRQSRSFLFERDDHLGEYWTTTKGVGDISILFSFLFCSELVLLHVSHIPSFLLSCAVVYVCMYVVHVFVLRLCQYVLKCVSGCEVFSLSGSNVFLLTKWKINSGCCYFNTKVHIVKCAWVYVLHPSHANV